MTYKIDYVQANAGNISNLTAGTFGIGTTSPHCPLQVNGHFGYISSANRIHWAYYNYNSGTFLNIFDHLKILFDHV